MSILEDFPWIRMCGFYSREPGPQDASVRGAPISGAANLALVYSDPESFVNHDFNAGLGSLALIGGTVSFDLDRDWSFDPSQPEGGTSLDFYSIALHEIGHGLGLNARSVAEFRSLIVGKYFVGENTVQALQADTGEVRTGLEIVSPSSKELSLEEQQV